MLITSHGRIRWSILWPLVMDEVKGRMIDVMNSQSVCQFQSLFVEILVNVINKHKYIWYIWYMVVGYIF